ncbi:MAG: alpha/beta fold hydrolase, partial [Thermocrinis sp.]|uniref:alpha/beta fold hydrolase n=1 Tax=Thermocrinis sp. TaxID=2024383 RepID=UPI003BFC4907
EDYFSTDLRSYIPHINKPILLLHGTEDPVVPLRGALELYNLSRRAKLITFAGGHFPENEAVIFEVLKVIGHLRRLGDPPEAKRGDFKVLRHN